MPSAVFKQNSLIAGVISKQAWERSDIKTTHHGLRRGDNVTVRTQGGVSRRRGMRFVDLVPLIPQPVTASVTLTAPNGGDVSKLTNGDLTDYFKTTTAIGTTSGYVGFVATYAAPTQVEFFDVQMTSIDNGSNRAPIGSDEWQMQYTTDGGATWINAKSVYISNINDDSYRAYVGLEVNGLRLVRIGATSYAGYVLWVGGFQAWTTEGVRSQGMVRLQSLVKSYSQNYVLLFSDYSLDIYRNRALVAHLPTPQIQPSQLLEIKFSALGDSLVVTHQDIPPLLIQLFREDDIWRIFPIIFTNIPYYDASLNREKLIGRCKVTTNAGIITVNSTSAEFLSTDVGCMIYGNGGSGRIIQYTDANNVQIIEVNKFPAGWGGIAATGWSIERSSAPLWSEEDGYPECSGFFANRLWLGGCKRARNVLTASVIGDYFNFDQGDAQDDDAMVVALQSGTDRHAVRHIYSYDNLEVFTDTGIFSLKKFDAGSITALSAAFYFRKPIGCDPYIAPFRTEDSSSLFVKVGRNDVRELTYDDITYTYNANTRTLWCPDIIRGVKAVAVARSSEADIANHIFMVNGDGHLACMTYLFTSEGDIIYPTTRWITAGIFLDVASTLEDVYVVVERDGVKELDVITGNTYLDSEVYHENFQGGLITGLDHLANQVVQVRAGTEYLGEFEVSPDGSIEVPEGEWPDAHIGIAFTSTVVPISPELTEGTIADRWKSYYHVTISCYDTQDITVDGATPEFVGRTFMEWNQTDRTYKEGRFRVELGGEPSLTPTLRISQDKPLDFNIRCVVYKIDVN